VESCGSGAEGRNHARLSVVRRGGHVLDWALLELLVQSGLRIEEASELTTFDILKRKMPDGRIYYLLHIKPSKFDRARVIPSAMGSAESWRRSSDT